MPTRHLGLDLGGTNIKWVVVQNDNQGWKALGRGQVLTRAGDGPEAVVARLAEVGEAALDRCGPLSSVGIGVPGQYDPVSGTTKFLPNFPGDWANRPVAGPVGQALRLPAALINDARAFGLAELRLGAGLGASSMIGLTLGTGIGGAIAIDGKICAGPDGNAGELGHMTIAPDGPWCRCGNRGCLEAFARADQVAILCGATTAEEGVARARAGDPRAIDGIAQVGRYLGIGISNIVAAISPDRVVIGGGISAASDLLFEPIRAELHRRVHIASVDAAMIVAAELGTWAGGIGAAVHGAERAHAIAESRAAKAAASRGDRRASMSVPHEVG